MTATMPSAAPEALTTTTTATEDAATTKPKKKVHFPELDDQISSVVCEVPTRKEYEKSEMENMFFTRADYHKSRSAAKVTSKESERQGHSKQLEDTFCEKSTQAQERLNAWAAQGHQRRGLERWANPTHGEARQQDQFACIMAVLRAQDDMLASKKKIVDAEKLRKVSHKATKVSRHFARMMGKADSFAMAQELRSDALGGGGGSGGELLPGAENLNLMLSMASIRSDDMTAASTVGSEGDSLPGGIMVDEYSLDGHSMSSTGSLGSAGGTKSKFRRFFRNSKQKEENNNANATESAGSDDKMSRVA